MPLTIVVLSPPGMTRPSSPSIVGGGADLGYFGAELAQRAGVRLEVALQR